MEFSHVLPEKERNNFPDPMQHINAAKEIDPGCEICRKASDEFITQNGQLILEMLREFKSKITVEMALFVHSREIKAIAKIKPPSGDIASVGLVD